MKKIKEWLGIGFRFALFVVFVLVGAAWGKVVGLWWKLLDLFKRG